MTQDFLSSCRGSVYLVAIKKQERPTFLDLIMENSSIARVSALESSAGESF